MYARNPIRPAFALAPLILSLLANGCGAPSGELAATTTPADGGAPAEELSVAPRSPTRAGLVPPSRAPRATEHLHAESSSNNVSYGGGSVISNVHVIPFWGQGVNATLAERDPVLLRRGRTKPLYRPALRVRHPEPADRPRHHRRAHDVLTTWHTSTYLTDDDITAGDRQKQIDLGRVPGAEREHDLHDLLRRVSASPTEKGANRAPAPAAGSVPTMTASAITGSRSATASCPTSARALARTSAARGRTSTTSAPSPPTS